MSELTFLAGILAGLAASLHCVGMCGPIASGLVIALAPNGSAQAALPTLLVAQAGRITSYVIAGALVGLFGTTLYAGLDREIAHNVLRWAAGATLMWIGLSVAGLAPAPTALDSVTRTITERLVRIRLSPQPSYWLWVYSTGLMWGLLPCGMVFATLFFAMMSGTAQQGAIIMLGFGLGTLPSVTAAALGVASLKGWADRRGPRTVIGLALVSIAAISLFVPMKQIMAYCFPA
ncbi:MAG: sulfite exporter TauE/SafE family protein [Hyphomicrobium sp.]